MHHFIPMAEKKYSFIIKNLNISYIIHLKQKNVAIFVEKKNLTDVQN